MSAEHGLFPSKNLKKDFEETNLYVQSAPNKICVCMDVTSEGFTAKIEIKCDCNILEFQPVGRNKIAILGDDGTMQLWQFHSLGP